MTEAALEVGLRWEAVCDDLLARTARFPKTARYSIAARVDNLALDVLEGLTEARYVTGRRRREALGECNLRLTRLRVLLRLAHRRRYLADNGYAFVSERIDEAGRMLGGWLKRVDDRGAGAGVDR